MRARTPGRVEPGRGLDEVGSRSLGPTARLDDLLVSERRRLDDDLDERSTGGLDDGPDVRLDPVEVPGLRQAQVDHHVDLVGAVGHGPLRFCRFDLGRVRTGWETAHRRDHEVTGVCERQPARRHAHCQNAEVTGFGDERGDVRSRALRLEKRVVDEGGGISARGHGVLHSVRFSVVKFMG